MRTSSPLATKKLAYALLQWVAIALVLYVPYAASAANELLDPRSAFRLSGQMSSPTQLTLRFRIAEGYYLYRDKLRVAGSNQGPVALTPTLPKGKVKQDEFFGRVEIYRGEVAIPVSVPSAKSVEAISVRVTSQGCADIGVCYPPQEQTLVLGPKLGVVEAQGSKKPGSESLLEKLKQ